jgi:hypothetical protein
MLRSIAIRDRIRNSYGELLNIARGLQQVDVTPPDINLFSTKGGVHGASETREAFFGPGSRYVEPLEGTGQKLTRW